MRRKTNGSGRAGGGMMGVGGLHMRARSRECGAVDDSIDSDGNLNQAGHVHSFYTTHHDTRGCCRATLRLSLGMSDLLVLEIREIRKRIQQIPRVIARRDTNGILLSRRVGAGIDNVQDNHDRHVEAETRQADDDARGVLWRLLRGKRLGREDVRDAVRSKEQSAATVCLV